MNKVIYNIPKTNLTSFAWTVDDGYSYDSLINYLDFIKNNNVKITFFITSASKEWSKLADIIKSLILSGKVQIANHSHSHLKLTKLSCEQIKKEILDCHNFILKTFNVDARPYFRPPYGDYNMEVINIANSIGYTKIIMWSGTLIDTSTNPQYTRLLTNSLKYVNSCVIFLSHANKIISSKMCQPIYDIIKSRNLETVLIKDVI